MIEIEKLLLAGYTWDLIRQLTPAQIILIAKFL